MNKSTNVNRDYSRIIRFCTDFQVLLKAVEMYKTEHVASVDASVRLMKSFRTLVYDDTDLVMTSDASSLQIGPTYVPEKIIEKNPAITRVFKLFGARKIESIVITPDVSPDDLLFMAHTLTAPFVLSIAERQYEELEQKTRSRIMVSSLNMIEKDSASMILPHLIGGKIDGEINKATREMIYYEITRNIESTTRMLQKHLKRELQKDAPVCPRDTLPVACDRWVHVLGEMMEKVHFGEDTTGAERQRQIFELVLPYLQAIQKKKCAPEFTALMEQMEEGDIHTNIRLFAQYYDKILRDVEELETYRGRVSKLVKRLESVAHSGVSERDKTVSDIGQEIRSVAPGAVQFPALFDKILHRTFLTREPDLIQPMLFIAFNYYTEKPHVTQAAIDELVSFTLKFCKDFKNYCELTVSGFLKILGDSPGVIDPDKWIGIIRNIMDECCNTCKKITKCSILKTLSSELGRQVMPEDLAVAFLELWQRFAHALLNQDINIFRTQVVPMAEKILAPDQFDENGLQDRIADAWKSFADTDYFQTIFKRLVSPDREIRFETVAHLTGYGDFAVWLGLGGLNDQNWHLRRNLATVIGRVAPLDKPVFLKQVLRDRDWHVRLEVISALRRRIEEFSGEIKNRKNHPLGKIISLALLDGRKEIREETYAIFESIAPPDAVRALINAYRRLASVSDDYEVEERARICLLLSQIGTIHTEHLPDIVLFVSEVATQKEGLLTPQWMIPLKKAAVECLENIDSKESRDWLQKLARNKPYKRGVVGREARAAIKRLE
jgi:hypothetical protein